MRRADRLFQLIQHLRYDRAVTAQTLAEKLEVSERTIYRDIQDLSLSGVPIAGEAGVGYILMKGFQLSPLMFSETELSALLIGARMVQSWTDHHLAKAANQALDKILHVIPDRLRPELERTDIVIPDLFLSDDHKQDFSELRTCIKQQQAVELEYTSLHNVVSKRLVNPLGLFYWGKVWTLVAWCKLREDFRQFRVDRIQSVNVTKHVFESEDGQTLRDFIARYSPDNKPNSGPKT